jgi:hypothetical protein
MRDPFEATTNFGVIIFVLSTEHSYTHAALVGSRTGAAVELSSYDQLVKLRQLPRATYVFTDLDRLPTEMLREAARVYRQMRLQGIAALNDPARVLSRYGLLRGLFLRGINQFNVYRAEDGATPARWPVFLRTDGDHLGPLPELYRRPKELAAGIEQVVARGIPMSRLLVVEYAAQPTRPGLFTKFSCFRVGRTEFAHTNVHDSQWIAKTGRRDITPPDLYDEELRVVRDNPYGPAVAAAFDLACLDYGRADFGIVNGQVQIYEINSNPNIAFGDDHPSAARQQSYREFEQNYRAALRILDAPAMA